MAKEYDTTLGQKVVYITKKVVFANKELIIIIFSLSSVHIYVPDLQRTVSNFSNY